MSMNDPLGDMLTRIRNAQMRGKSTVRTPASKLRAWVLDVLQDVEDGIELPFPFRQDVRLYQFMVYHKGNIAGKDLIAIGDYLRPEHLDPMFFQHRCEPFHLPYHVGFPGVCTRKDMLQGFGVIRLFWPGFRTGLDCGSQQNRLQTGGFICDM